MEGQLWRGDYGGETMEALYYGRTTIEGLDYGGTTMEEGNHPLIFGDFSVIVGHLGKVLR